MPANKAATTAVITRWDFIKATLYVSRVRTRRGELRLISADIGVLDDFAHPSHVGLHLGCELLRRAADDLYAGVKKFLFHIRLLNESHDFLPESADDRRWCLSRREHARHIHRLIAGQAGGRDRGYSRRHRRR